MGKKRWRIPAGGSCA